MVVGRPYMANMIREGMDHYWLVVYSKTDDGLSATELRWKRQHEADMARWDERFGADFDRIFGKAS
jgi:hypothetical protein